MSGNFNHIPDLIEQLDYLATHQVVIGIFVDATREDGGPMLKIAYAHEFGAEIPKRFKNGPPEDCDSPWIIIPERSYLRAGFDANADDIQEKMDHLLDQVFALKVTGKAALEALGGYVVGKIQAYLIDLKKPPLKDLTIRRKGSSNPLVDTGQLKDSITWKIEEIK